VVVDPRGDSPVWGTNPPAGAPDNNLVQTHLDIIASPAVARRVVETLKLEQEPRLTELLGGANPLTWMREQLRRLLPDREATQPASRQDWIAEQLLRRLRLNANRDSKVIKVTSAAAEPEFAARVANAFVNAYRDTLLQLRVQPAKQNAEWFDEQVKPLKARLEAAETRLAKFQQEKGILATDERVDLENARLADLSAQLAAAQTQSYESRARQQHLRGFLGRTGGEDAPPEVLASPVVQQLKQTIADREAKVSELSRRNGANHPQHQAAVGEVQRLKTQLRDEMTVAAQSALTGASVAGEREGSLRGALDQQRGRVLQLKRERGELAMLAREVDSAQRVYNAAVDRLSQTRLESALEQVGVSSIVTSATAPLQPTGPGATLILAAALAAGLAVGVGFALFLETISRRIRTEADIADLLGVPVLAVLRPKLARRRRAGRLAPPEIRRLSG
jgi:chain length determinant protein EpsF